VSHFPTVALVWLLLVGAARAQAIPHGEAATAFLVAKEISDRDGGRLWGTPVCGPLMFGDARTNEVVANQADGEGQLQAIDGVWAGRLPRDRHVANTAIDWASVRWTLVMWQELADTRQLAPRHFPPTASCSRARAGRSSSSPVGGGRPVHVLATRRCLSKQSFTYAALPALPSDHMAAYSCDRGGTSERRFSPGGAAATRF
jgi:hypothetical protein